MPVSEITEEKDEESPLVVGKERLRQILEYQKSLYLSSSSPSLYISAPSGSSFSVVKAIPLWGSDADDEIHDPWASIKQVGPTNDSETDGQNKAATEGSFMDREFGVGNRKVITSNHKLTRKKSYRRLPGFGLWRCRGFRFRLKLKRFRIMICARKF